MVGKKTDNKEIAKRRTRRLLLILLSIFLFLLVILILIASIYPKVLILSPEADSQNVSVNSTIKIDFSMPVNRDLLIPSIEPEIPGEWIYEDPTYKNHLCKSLTFVPLEVLKPDTNYRVELSNIQGFFNKRGSDFDFNFTTRPPPKVLKSELISLSELRVTLSEPNEDLAVFDFYLEPETEFAVKLNETRTEYSLVPKKELLPNTLYTLTVFGTTTIRDKELNRIVYEDEIEPPYEETLNTSDFSYQPQPKVLGEDLGPSIINYLPSGNNILVGKNIEITFSEPMNKASVEENFLINPNLPGLFTWTDDNLKVVFNPDRYLFFGTRYQVKILKEAKSKEGISLSDDFLFYFQTVGRVKAFVRPRRSARRVNVRSAIKVYFNQKVNAYSAKRLFLIRPRTKGRFYFSGNWMIFRPSRKLRYQRKYRVVLRAGVKSIYGHKSNRSFKTVFTTQNQTLRLRIRLDFQDYPLSCEIAALKMALRYKGVRVSEKRILRHIKQYPYRRNWWRNSWGDPYREFVGSLYGRQNVTGYGVYWQPIAKAARVWRPRSRATVRRLTVGQMLRQVAKGNPVVVWGVCSRYSSVDGWFTHQGRYVYARSGEHAKVVIGFIGGPNRASRIILNDPIKGRLYWTRKKFMRDWRLFGKAAVIVR